MTGTFVLLLHGLDALVRVIEFVALLALWMRGIAVGQNLRRHADGKACGEESSAMFFISVTPLHLGIKLTESPVTTWMSGSDWMPSRPLMMGKPTDTKLDQLSLEKRNPGAR